MKIKLFVLMTVLSFVTFFVFSQNDTSLVEIREVVISASRSDRTIKDLAMSVSVIDNEKIETMAVHSLDDVLKSSPGIHVIRPLGIFGKSNVSVRGLGAGEQGRVLVLQDGIPINVSDLGEVNWNRIYLSDISSVEILRGPSSDIYGSNAMGGIINIISDKDKNRLSALFSSGYGTYNTIWGNMKVTGNILKNKKMFFAIGTYYRKSDGYISQPDSLRDSTNIASRMKEYGIFARSKVKLKGNNSINFTYDFYNDRRSQGVKIFDEVGNVSDHDTHFAGINYTGKKSKLKWKMSAYFQNEHYFRIVETYKKSYSLYHVNSMRNDFGFLSSITYKTPKNILTIGTDFKKGEVNGADEYQTSLDIIRNIGDVGTISGFVYDNFKIHKNISMCAALHYNNVHLLNSEFLVEEPSSSSDFLLPFVSNISNKKWQTLSPKISVQYLNNRFKVYTSYSEGFRAPTLDDLTRTGFIAGAFKLSNPDLKPEKVKNFEIGSSYMTDKIKIMFSSYLTKGKEFLYYVETGEFIFGKKPIVMKQNITDIQITGAEASFDYTYNKNFNVFINYSYREGKIVNFDQNVDLEGKILTRFPNNVFNLGFNLRTKFLNFSSSIKIISKQFLDDLNNLSIPEQYLPDMKFYKVYNNGMGFSVTIQNLLDNRYLIYYDQLSIGRFISLELSYIFKNK